MGRWVGAWVGGWVSGRVDMGGWVRVWLCACRVRAFRAARRVRVVGTRACVDLFASAGSRGSSLPCGCLRLRVGPPSQDPKRATRASEPFVGDRRLGDHSTRARLKPVRPVFRMIPQNFFQSPPRRESGTISPTRTRDTALSDR